MPKRTASYRTWLSEKLTDSKIASRYLNEARKDSPEVFFKALRRVAESRKMAKVAEDAGVSRESLYRMTSETGNPTHSSFAGILKAVGLDYMIVPLMTEPASTNHGIDIGKWGVAGSGNSINLGIHSNSPGTLTLGILGEHGIGSTASQLGLPGMAPAPAAFGSSWLLKAKADPNAIPQAW
jgi:probable addiction module antidote protein